MQGRAIFQKADPLSQQAAATFDNRDKTVEDSFIDYTKEKQSNSQYTAEGILDVSNILAERSGINALDPTDSVDSITSDYHKELMNASRLPT